MRPTLDGDLIVIDDTIALRDQQTKKEENVMKIVRIYECGCGSHKEISCFYPSVDDVLPDEPAYADAERGMVCDHCNSTGGFSFKGVQSNGEMFLVTKTKLTAIGRIR